MTWISTHHNVPLDKRNNMVTVPNAIVRHGGILVDNTTKLTVFFPELTPEQDAELVQHAKFKEAAVIIMDPNDMQNVLDMIKQAQEISTLPHTPQDPMLQESQEEWSEDEETGFESR